MMPLDLDTFCHLSLVLGFINLGYAGHRKSMKKSPQFWWFSSSNSNHRKRFRLIMEASDDFWIVGTWTSVEQQKCGKMSPTYRLSQTVLSFWGSHICHSAWTVGMPILWIWRCGWRLWFRWLSGLRFTFFWCSWGVMMGTGDDRVLEKKCDLEIQRRDSSINCRIWFPSSS